MIDELVKIMECRSTYKLFVLPVFYDVDPSDVRKQQGSFAEAFARHGERYKGTDMDGKVETWRAALTEVADLAGRHLQNDANGNGDRLCNDNIKRMSLLSRKWTWGSILSISHKPF
ncbi:hypothetical protein L1049_013510 [Liquidambar formosana]|uniref:ADP-ribosyl cyclase/cyclic ADP-ribose hydrolase n=1 Tax=Liquidambar formosana TaxID=63359 RepID=A0AAP0RLK0_LIQFO